MLTIQGLNQYYGQSHTLWDVELTIKPGECTALMGRNGVGKTSLLKCVMGELPLASGSIHFHHNDITAVGIEQRSGMGIGYVPQGRQIFPLLTVEENLRIGLSAKKASSHTIPPLIFALFPVLGSMLSRRGGDLSGGQQQQLAIARALVLEPELLILDEPTEGIQPNLVTEIGDIIKTLKDEWGLTILLVEQKLPFIRKAADNFYIMDRGRNRANGRINELNNELIEAYLTA